jgi:membrane protease YdiL (CAAX protease family)
LLLTWALGTGIRKGSNQLPSALRPWVLIGVSVFFAASTGKPGPVVFAIVLALGLAAVWLLVRRGKRHVRAVYATAALFAMVHAAVWPSPIPLFLLGLGLGWIAVRTGGVAAPALLHGLFNSVSVVFVLRGSPN